MNETKRQVLPAGLWVVATPIGNLADMSPRARQALEQCDLIACEDTRRTAQLLSALMIPGKKERKLERMDAHATGRAIEHWVERLCEGLSVALVTDAGTPAISDPGARLVRAARERGIRVTPVPGPSALMAALSVAGIEETAFLFGGFFPRKAAEREDALRQAENCAFCRVFAWFESPQRVLEALEAAAAMQPACEAFVAKELSKIHERFFWGTIHRVRERIAEEIEREGAVGEWCFVLRFPESGKKPTVGAESSDWVKTLQCLLDARVAAPEAAKRVSQHFGVARKQVYEMALRISGKKMGKGG